MEQCVASGSVNRLPHPSEGTSVTSSALPISLCHKAALCSRRAVLELFPVPGVLRNSGTEIAVPGRTVVPVAHKTLPEASLPTFFFFLKKKEGFGSDLRKRETYRTVVLSGWPAARCDAETVSRCTQGCKHRKVECFGIPRKLTGTRTLSSRGRARRRQCSPGWALSAAQCQPASLSRLLEFVRCGCGCGCGRNSGSGPASDDGADGASSGFGSWREDRCNPFTSSCFGRKHAMTNLPCHHHNKTCELEILYIQPAYWHRCSPASSSKLQPRTPSEI